MGDISEDYIPISPRARHPDNAADNDCCGKPNGAGCAHRPAGPSTTSVRAYTKHAANVEELLAQVARTQRGPGAGLVEAYAFRHKYPGGMGGSDKKGER